MTKQEFWLSFERHMPQLQKLISGETHDFDAYNDLSDGLRQFNEYLVPEITMDTDNQFVLVISCDGNRRGISALEQLTEGIDNYPTWKIVKYRQAGPMEFIPLNGHNVKRRDILLTWDKTAAGKYTLTFYLKWRLNAQVYQSGAILHLDHTIGEYNAMTKIEAVEFKSLKLFKSKVGLKTLDDLKTDFDNH